MEAVSELILFAEGEPLAKSQKEKSSASASGEAPGIEGRD